MEYSPTDLEAFVRQRAPEIAKGIRAAAGRARIEVDLVAEVERVLERFARNFDVGLRLERERTLINGRADAVYNRFVIEYEPPGSLRKDRRASTNRHAVEQVQRYIEGLAQADRHRKERLAGVALDGYYYIFVRFRDGHWREDDPVPVSAHSTETFLRYLLSLSTELALTPENMVRDFGENTAVSRMAVSALYDALVTSESPKVQVLFQQWQRMFSEICGYEEGSTRLNVTKLAKSYGVTGHNVSALYLFFAIHTYYATFIKLLAVQVAHYYLMPKVGTGLAQVASADTGSLHAYLEKMEHGGAFSDFGIKNFLEGDFFGWYLESWNPRIETTMRRLVGDLANYSLVTLDVDPEETRDLLKQLYQNLVPKKLRHNLGEYYTPDWLAERLLNQLCGAPRKGELPTLAPGKRLLDPACGSGTFLVLAIKRVRRYAEDKMLPPADVLEQILRNVVGFDLNPLAVITARTNYLLALGDLLPYRRGEISLPVYLADSIMTPTAGDDLFSRHAYSFNTAVGRFSIPRSLVDARSIDQLADLLEESVTVDLSRDQFSARLLRVFPLNPVEDAAEVNIALNLYGQLQELEHQGVNGIWARIIKNAFAPLFQGHFDYVAGNPPWVNWESLPTEYREQTVNLWHHYGLLPEDKADARQRSKRSKTEIAILMSLVAIDQYLADDSKLGFVITQTIFKTERGGRGFRRFRVSDSLPIMVEYVDDLSALQVFDGAQNRTSVVVMKKGQQTKYPVPYGFWRKRKGGRTIPTDLSLSEALELVRISQWIAQPISSHDLTSPWITGRQRAIGSIHKVLGKSAYHDVCREGANTRGANGIFFVERLHVNVDSSSMVANLPKAGRLHVDSIQGTVEDNVLYPLLRGQEVSRWNSCPENWIIVPHDPARPSQPIAEPDMKAKYPKAYQFLSSFRDKLSNRSKFRSFDPSVGEFYPLYNVGRYTFMPFKVVWREQASSLTCAVIPPLDGKPIVPDHKLMLVPFREEEEAHFLCACLSSSPADFAVRSYSIEIQISTHVLRYVRIPRYNRRDTTHRQLAVLSEEAHMAATRGQASNLREIESSIDRLAAKMWGLTDKELQEIQENLAELG